MWTSGLDSTFQIYTPPPNQTATEWADENFYLSPESSSEPGRYDSRRTPFVKGILDAFTDLDVETISLRAPRQVVKTTVILIFIGMSIDIDPCPMLLVEPTLDLAERVSKRRIAPMLRDVSKLSAIVGPDRTRDANNTILNKTFRGGALTVAGANSTTGLISEPRKKILYDEVDYYPPTIGHHGDPVATSLECAITFWDRKIVYVSRPSVKGLSRIDACIEGSDDRRFYVPCHACGEKQELIWEQVKWTDRNPDTAFYVCKFCNEPWTDKERIDNMLNGEWIATKPFAGHAGFSLNGIYHVWRPLRTLVRNFLEANRKKKMGNLQPLRDWENDEFGQSWEEEGEKLLAQPLMDRRETYGSERIPWQTLYVTAGVDVQDDRVEIEVVGWRAVKRDDNLESWGLEDLVLYFDKDEDGKPVRPGSVDSKKTWDEFDEMLKKQYTTQDGRTLRISAACIDSGGHRTDEVYKFCNRRLSRHIYAVKGRDGSYPIWPRRGSKSKKFKGSLVWLVGVDTAKDAIYNSLRVVTHGPGYAHFPIAYELQYFEQLTSEKVRTKYRNGRPVRYWELPSGVRNEALDRRVYAMAAVYARPVPWEILARGAPSEPPPETPEGEPPPLAAAPTPQPPPKPTGGRKVRFRFGR